MKTVNLLTAILVIFSVASPCALADFTVNEEVNSAALQSAQSNAPDSAITIELSKEQPRVTGIQPSGFSPEKAALKAGGGLLLMLGFLFFVAYLAKRKGLMQNHRQRKLLLRETLSLGAKEKLAVVDFAGESMVVGITAHNIRLIRAVKKSDSDDYESNPELGAKTAFDFQTKLNDFLLKGSR